VIEINENLKNVLGLSSNLDKKIYHLLKKRVLAIDIFKQIRKHSDTEGVSRFLYTSGLYKNLLTYSLKLLNSNKQVAWHYVMRVLIKYDVCPKKKLAEIVFHNWLKDYKHFAMFACEQWGNISPEFEQMRVVFLDQLKNENMSGENSLLERLAFIQKQQGMLSEEKEIIEKLIRLNPLNKDYQKLKKDVKEKEALLIIQSQRKTKNKKQSLKNDFFKLNLNHSKDIKKEWLDVINRLAIKDVTKIKNLAFFLYFCDYPKSAIEILEKNISQSTDYWFYLDWLLEAKQFSKGLNIVNYLFSRTENSQFDFLPLLYIKAKFLYALGQYSLAIECLKEISQVYPDYKNINYFLNKWSQYV